MELFGEMLERCYRRRGWTQQEFAEERLGTTSIQVSRIRRGLRPPHLEDMEKWANALDLSPEEREKFLDLAALAKAGSRAERLVQRLHDRVVEAERLLDQELGRRAAEKKTDYDPR